MTWNDILRKLTSRKFWVAIALFVVGLTDYLNKGQTDLYNLIMIAGSVVAYIVGEGLNDSKTVIEETKNE